MTITQKILVKATLGSALVAASVFVCLLAYSNRHRLFRDNSKSLSDLPLDPLPYDSIGNFPAIEEGLMSPPRYDREYTLEITTCNDKNCIGKTLHTLIQKGVDAFYTPSQSDGKLIFRIRRGIFTSRQSAERAQALLNKEKRIHSTVVEL